MPAQASERASLSCSECKLPFEYAKSVHSKCITKDSGNGQPWCYKTSGGWGYCPNDCAGAAKWCACLRFALRAAGPVHPSVLSLPQVFFFVWGCASSTTDNLGYQGNDLVSGGGINILETVMLQIDMF